MDIKIEKYASDKEIMAENNTTNQIRDLKSQEALNEHDNVVESRNVTTTIDNGVNNCQVITTNCDLNTPNKENALLSESNLVENGSSQIMESVISNMFESPTDITPVIASVSNLTSKSITASTPSRNCDYSSDESSNLQIVLPPSGKKRKRSNLLDFDKEIEQYIRGELDKVPKKSGLTVAKVKNILRYVIGNESVLAMVSKSMKSAGEETGLDVDLKLTRSKAKRLREETQMLWPLSPILPVEEINNEHLVLIREELPEEEDDEEYRPTLDDLQDHSDDESGRQSTGTPSLDLSSASRYLENFDPRLLDDSVNNSQQTDISSNTREDKTDKFIRGNFFKRPKENIGQRTRSKLSLSGTPLETIEQAFIPPDITTDMYDLKCDDRDWEKFLKEFMQPLSNDTADGDEEDDPEYNAVGEEEELDKEELRRDRGATVSRAELKTLMIELLGIEDQSSDEETLKESEEIIPADTPQPPSPDLEISKTVKKESEAIEVYLPPSPPPQIEEPSVIGITKNQQLLLMQQIRQHAQLLTQHFIQSHRHPIHSKIAARCKIMLAELVELSKLNPNSAVNVFNLRKAFELVEKWEMFLDSSKGEEIIKHCYREAILAQKARKKRLLVRPTFHKKMMQFVVESDVFMYPLLLPTQPFRSDNPIKAEFLTSEDELIALGLEQLIPYLQKYPRWSDGRQGPDRIAADLIHELLLRSRSTLQVVRRIRSMKLVEGNPIWHYFTFNTAPGTKHFVIPFTLPHVLRPVDQRPELLKEPWREFVHNFKKKKHKQKTVLSDDKDNKNFCVK